MNSASLLYENSEILLVNKPAGVSVQGGAGVSHPLDKELSAQLGYQVCLVHRLDKDTAGILVVAKNPVAAAKWIKLLQDSRVKKEYAAVLLGIPCINGKHCLKGTLRGEVEAHGRVQDAETHYTIEKSCALPETSGEVVLSLARITLGTGRMHQIRIQMAHAGAPVAADDQHGNFKQNKLVRKLGIRKLQLAAVKLTLPLDGGQRTFEIPLPQHIQSVVDTLLC